MSEIIIFGDSHIRSEEPFGIAFDDFQDWTRRQPWNNEENIGIHVGDVFHSNQPTPHDYDRATKFFGELKFKKIYIMSGNGIHEFNRSKQTYSIQPLNHLPNVQIITAPVQQSLFGMNILFMPWIPSSLYNKSMKEVYENYQPVDAPDFVFGHFAFTPFFNTEIDIKHIKGKRFFGHLHIPTDDYVGVNVISRYDEKEIDCSLVSIDSITKKYKRIPIPKFLDYESVTYPNAVPERDHYQILDIVDAPSIEIATDKYCDYDIRHIFTKVVVKDIDGKEVEEDGNDKSINSLFNGFVKDQKVASDVANLIRKVI